MITMWDGADDRTQNVADFIRTTSSTSPQQQVELFIQAGITSKEITHGWMRIRETQRFEDANEGQWHINYGS